ncbi:MAG: ROK family protein [Lachnospiraceae bacterium]|nr:ROK family protein [Lachnospiraceae bacterium]
MAEKYAFGIDIGGTTVKIGLFAGRGELLYKCSIKTDISEEGENIICDTANCIKDIINLKSISFSEISGIGVCVPGPVMEGGTTSFCPNIGWRMFNVEKAFSDILDLPVKSGNDATFAALGEKWQGSAKSFSNFVMIVIGTGIGGGIFVDGKPVLGLVGAAGEIGHMTVNPFETEYCRCGKRGCLEQYASATGIINLTKKYIKEGLSTSLGSSNLDLTNLDLKDIFKAYNSNDECARKAVDIFIRYLGLAMANINSVLDPEAFIIGGGVSNSGDFILDKIKEAYARFSFSEKGSKTITISKLKTYAGIYGGASLFLLPD